ncbi:FAD-dependent oxidoreductase [Sphingomonas sp. CL5.1]|uniref:FAD-dependent oxidoreductase n=1 Tax=Sphingomonas sp. CL5.1 TaxID=2653203 RepID=UPI0015835379|nr:FAD-dependent oxidoreductase [Sphingomonas sp. CL5.1]QKS01141.1 FAD-dependent oxidoreductase [Sphingomonas sp. CL5.1]
MRSIVIVGSGIAGLSAALTAAQKGARVILVDRAPDGEHGGNTRYTEAYLRMKSLDEVADDFVDHFMANAGGYTDPGIEQEMVRDHDGWSALARSQSAVDPELLGSFVENAGLTLRWLEQAGLTFDFLPTAFITTTTTRLLPVGGGLAMVETLTEACKAAGVEFRFETTARALITHDGRVTGIRTTKGDLEADAVILACGGFEGNPEMLARYIGAAAINLRPVARGGHYNKGEGIRMALDIGAAPNGDFGSYHAEPIDPRSGCAEPAIFTFPYGILVNKDGDRFTDEAPGTVDAHYESVTRRIFQQRDGIAWLITDAGLDDVPNWRKGSRTDQPALVADTLPGLAGMIGLPAGRFAETVERFNAACRAGDFRPLETDGLSTEDLWPPKSNWARPLTVAPFRAWPIISANVFTFGGLKIDRHARVLDLDGNPIPGLYTAGETVGIYYRTYTGSTSVLRGAVFGRLAALHCAGAVA